MFLKGAINTKKSKHRRHSLHSDEAEEAGSEEEVSGDEEPADAEDIAHSVSLRTTNSGVLKLFLKVFTF